MSGPASNYEPLNHDDLPQAAFTYTPHSGLEPLTVVFTDASTPNSGDYTITDWLWDFGDGTTSTSQSPTHIFGVHGTYTVVLWVTNPFGLGKVQHQVVTTEISYAVPAHVMGVGSFLYNEDGDLKYWDGSNQVLVLEDALISCLDALEYNNRYSFAENDDKLYAASPAIDTKYYLRKVVFGDTPAETTLSTELGYETPGPAGSFGYVPDSLFVGTDAGVSVVNAGTIATCGTVTDGFAMALGETAYVYGSDGVIYKLIDGTPSSPGTYTGSALSYPATVSNFIAAGYTIFRSSLYICGKADVAGYDPLSPTPTGVGIILKLRDDVLTIAHIPYFTTLEFCELVYNVTVYQNKLVYAYSQGLSRVVAQIGASADGDVWTDDVHSIAIGESTGTCGVLYQCRDSLVLSTYNGNSIGTVYVLTATDPEDSFTEETLFTCVDLVSDIIQ